MKDAYRGPIGIFDSGVGGLTVMHAITRSLPHLPMIYFGDTGRLPYGEKSAELVIQYSVENSRFLMQFPIELIVIACNTASCYAVEAVKKRFGGPVVDVISPAAQKAVETTQSGRIGVIGTRRTIASAVYEKTLLSLNSRLEVRAFACPLLVPLIEEEMIDHPATELILRDYLKPFREARIDTLVLGCTHYPLLHHLIQRELGPGVEIIDSASCCAQRIREVFEVLPISDMKPDYRFFVSDQPDKFQRIGEKFLGFSMPLVELVPATNASYALEESREESAREAAVCQEQNLVASARFDE